MYFYRNGWLTNWLSDWQIAQLTNNLKCAALHALPATLTSWRSNSHLNWLLLTLLLSFFLSRKPLWRFLHLAVTSYDRPNPTAHTRVHNIITSNIIAQSYACTSGRILLLPLLFIGSFAANCLRDSQVGSLHPYILHTQIGACLSSTNLSAAAAAALKVALVAIVNRNSVQYYWAIQAACACT